MLPDPVVLGVLTTLAPFAQRATISLAESLCSTVNPVRSGSNGLLQSMTILPEGSPHSAIVCSAASKGMASTTTVALQPPAYADSPGAPRFLDHRRNLGGTRLPHAEKNVVSGCRPALAQRGAHVSCSNNGDLHPFSFGWCGGDRSSSPRRGFGKPPS